MWWPFTQSAPVSQSLYKSLSEPDSELVTSLRTITSIIDTAWAWNLCPSAHTGTLYNTRALHRPESTTAFTGDLWSYCNSLHSTHAHTCTHIYTIAKHLSLPKLTWICWTWFNITLTNDPFRHQNWASGSKNNDHSITHSRTRFLQISIQRRKKLARHIFISLWLKVWRWHSEENGLSKLITGHTHTYQWRY